MAQGLSLHIGVNQLDTGHYGLNVPPLNACHNDAHEMEKFAHFLKYDVHGVLLDDQATRTAVQDAINAIAGQLDADDAFLLTFSGHGSQVPEKTGLGQADEDDGLEETWCLFDGMLLDDELRLLFSKFAPGARIYVVSDSCHAGTAAHEWIHAFWGYIRNFVESEGFRFRHLREALQEDIYKKNRNFYRALQENLAGEPYSGIKASVCLLAACQDNQRAIEDPFQGRFTSAFLYAYENHFSGNMRHLHKEISKHLRAIQSPNLLAFGANQKSILDAPAFVI